MHAIAAAVTIIPSAHHLPLPPLDFLTSYLSNRFGVGAVAVFVLLILIGGKGGKDRVGTIAGVVGCSGVNAGSDSAGAGGMIPLCTAEKFVHPFGT